MNLANRLTVARLVCIPFIMICLTVDTPFTRWAAMAIFIIASVTDFFDGIIARSRNEITVLGKFLDPLADKALVCTVLVYMVNEQLCDPIVLIVVLIREFIVSGVRMAAVSDGKVVAANLFGKAKTLFQMVALATILGLRALLPQWSGLQMLSQVCCWIIAVLTALSGWTYVWDNREVFKEGNA